MSARSWEGATRPSTRGRPPLITRSRPPDARGKRPVHRMGGRLRSDGDVRLARCRRASVAGNAAPGQQVVLLDARLPMRVELGLGQRGATPLRAHLRVAQAGATISHTACRARRIEVGRDLRYVGGRRSLARHVAISVCRDSRQVRTSSPVHSPSQAGYAPSLPKAAHVLHRPSMASARRFLPQFAFAA